MAHSYGACGCMEPYEGPKGKEFKACSQNRCCIEKYQCDSDCPLSTLDISLITGMAVIVGVPCLLAMWVLFIRWLRLKIRGEGPALDGEGVSANEEGVELREPLPVLPALAEQSDTLTELPTNNRSLAGALGELQKDKDEGLIAESEFDEAKMKVIDQFMSMR